MKTINYYNTKAQEFYDRTIHTDLSENYAAFTKYLPKKASILDAGCGVGRDSIYFLNQGYQVTAFDASREMASMASKETGLFVSQLTFQEMNFDSLFDGVWAQASLLHISYEETETVYRNIARSLKPNGIFYASYKYGNELMETSERDFWNMNEEKAKAYLKEQFIILEMETQKDTRSKVSPSKEGLWLNFIAKKKE